MKKGWRLNVSNKFTKIKDDIQFVLLFSFLWDTLYLLFKGNFTSESEVAKTNFERQALEKLGSVREVLPELSREYRRCDPKNHKEGETFLQVKGFLQVQSIIIILVIIILFLKLMNFECLFITANYLVLWLKNRIPPKKTGMQGRLLIHKYCSLGNYYSNENTLQLVVLDTQLHKIYQ